MYGTFNHSERAPAGKSRHSRRSLHLFIFHIHVYICTYNTYINQIENFQHPTILESHRALEKPIYTRDHHIKTDRYDGPKIHQHTCLCLTRRQQLNALLAALVLASSNALTIAAAIPTATPASNRAATKISG